VLRVDLPGGQWADIKPAEDLTGEDEVKVMAAIPIKRSGQQDDTDVRTDGSSTSAMEYAMLARVITAWSLPQPINVSNIRSLRLSQLRPLKEAVRPHFAELQNDPNSLSGGETATG